MDIDLAGFLCHILLMPLSVEGMIRIMGRRGGREEEIMQV
jgi:hypothetical protein